MSSKIEVSRTIADRLYYNWIAEKNLVENDNPSKFFSALQSHCSRLSVILLSYDSRSTLVRLDRRKKNWSRNPAVKTDEEEEASSHCSVIIKMMKKARSKFVLVRFQVHKCEYIIVQFPRPESKLFFFFFSFSRISSQSLNEPEPTE